MDEVPKNPYAKPKNPVLWVVGGILLGSVGALTLGEVRQTRQEHLVASGAYKPLPVSFRQPTPEPKLTDAELQKALSQQESGSFFSYPNLIGDPNFPTTLDEAVKKFDDKTKDLNSIPPPQAELSGKPLVGATPVDPFGIGTNVAPESVAVKPKSGKQDKPNAPEKEDIEAMSGDSNDLGPVASTQPIAAPQDPKEVLNDSLQTASMISDADPDKAIKQLIAMAKKLGGRGISLMDFNPKQRPVKAIVLFVPANKFNEMLTDCETSGAVMSQQFTGGSSKRRSLYQKNAKAAFLALSAEREKMREKYEDNAPWVQECEENLLAAKNALNILSDAGTGMAAIKVVFPV